MMSLCSDLGLAQILPMFDDETGAEPKIVSASFADPFVLLLRDDSSIYVAQCDEDNELEELEREDDLLLSTKWLTGCLYDDRSGAFSSSSTPDTTSTKNKVMFLLSAEGTLVVSLTVYSECIAANTTRSMHFPIFRNLCT